MAVLATWVPEDALLGAVAPLALAAAAGTCLVVDLDPDGPRYPGEATLASLVADSPHRDHLTPRRRGVAVLANGGVAGEDARPVLDALVAGWPNVVLRLPATPHRPDVSGVVPVVLDLPGSVVVAVTGRRVVQRSAVTVRRRHGAGVVVLPSVRRSTVRTLLDGRLPGPGRWMAAWRPVWRMRWV